MKKLLTILLALLMVFSLAGCGSDEEGSDATEKSKMEIAKEAGKITIANVVNGTLGDKSFFDSGEEGMQLINANLGDKMYGETIELSYDKSTWATGIEEVFKAGWDIIIAGTYDMKEHVIPLLEQYPDQKVWFYDEMWNFDDPDGWQYAPSDKLYAMMFSQNEGSYIVGYMAAMLTNTGYVAFMGGQDNTVLDDFFVGFANGARAYGEKAGKEIHVNCTWMDSFNDPTTGLQKATGLYAAGYDIVFACGGQAGLGGFDAVITTDEGNYIIGVDGNQGEYFASLGTAEGDSKAARTITSMQKNVNNGFYAAAQLEIEGKVPYGTNAALGLDGGYVSAAITDVTKALFTAEQLAEVEDVQNAIIAGDVNPGTAFGQADGWFAAFVDSVK